MKLVRFGSFAIGFAATTPDLDGILVRRFRAVPALHLDVEPDIVIAFGEEAAAPPDACDALRLERHGSIVRIWSDTASLEVDWRTRPATATLTTHPASGREAYVEHYVAVLLHKLLQVAGIVRLHAAAVEIDGATHVFAGAKGAGKSTLSLALGRGGGRVLADDQIVIRRRDAGLMVSGCDGNIRLTADTEHHFLTTPLDAAPQDYAGVLKKEVSLSGIVSAIPHEERAATRLYFPVVGTRLDVRPMTSRAALERLLADIVPAHRFASPADQLDLVRLVTDFVRPLRCAVLELSPRLADLGELRALLS